MFRSRRNKRNIYSVSSPFLTGASESSIRGTKGIFSTLLVLAALGIVDELSDERDKTARYANRIKNLEFRVDNPASLTVERGTLHRLEAVTKAFEGLEKKLKNRIDFLAGECAE